MTIPMYERIRFSFKLKCINDGNSVTNFRRVACDAGNGTDIEKVARTYLVNFAGVDEHV